MGFMGDLDRSWSRHQSLLCVGLDPDPAKMPASIRSGPRPFWAFAKAIIDATADLVCAFKPQIAYYAAAGAEDELAATIEYVHRAYPGTPVILDAKRGDIGSSAQMYAREAFERYQADAVTVNPYLGTDALLPFLEYREKGVVVLCRTSNPAAREFQDLATGGRKLYQLVAAKAAGEWNRRGNVLLVVGATYPRELAEVRAMVGNMPLLVPGVGAQGADVRAAVRSGVDAHGKGMIINSSRGILYASRGGDFAAAARRAAGVLRDEINRWRHADGSTAGT